MFKDTIRALRKLEGQTQFSVPIDDDEEGYFDRECPSGECLFQFKILSEDWKEKVRNKEVFCPNCGHTASSDKWWTKEQIEHARQAALAQVKARISGALRRDASGAAYFCPACGHNAADRQFGQTIGGIRQSLESLDAVRAAITDRDIAENTTRLIVENGLQNVVTAFQRCAEALFSGLPASPKPRRNAFQNLVEGNQLWQAATGKVYSDHVAPEEFAALQRIFQQRHLLAHTQGLVDQDYVTKSGDTRYKPGQRIVVRIDTVKEATALIEKLMAGMKADVSASNPEPGE